MVQMLQMLHILLTCVMPSCLAQWVLRSDRFKSMSPLLGHDAVIRIQTWSTSWLNLQQSYMRAPTSVRRHTALLIQASSQNIALKSQDFLPSGLFCSLCEASQATGASKALGIATEMRTGLLALPAVSKNIAFNNSLSSYLQISLFRSARPPKQLEFAKIWA